MDQKSPLSKESLTTQYYDPIYSYCLRRLPDRESAEDTAQEVFCAFWEGPEFTDERVAVGWLYRVAKSKVGDFYRAQYRRLKHEVPIPPEDLPDNAVPAAEDEALKSSESDGDDPGLLLEGALGDGVRTLSEGERRLFREVWIEKIPYNRLAAAYGTSEGALRTKVSRLKRKLTKLLRTLVWPAVAVSAVVLETIMRFFTGRV